MGLRQALDQELQAIVPAVTAWPHTVRVTDAQGRQLRVLLSALDTLSAAISELELFVPQLQSAAFSVLEDWAKRLSQRISYLLEQIGPLEVDQAAQQVLIRSLRPDQLPDGVEYYEVILSRLGAGTFLLKRYKAIKGQSGRTAVDLVLTRQVLGKLVEDLEATIP
jgi:hypothetical protein